MAEVQDILAINLARAYEASGLKSYAELEKVSGVDYAVVRRILKKESWPGIDTLTKLARALKVTTADLFNPGTPPAPTVIEHTPEQCYERAISKLRAPDEVMLDPPKDISKFPEWLDRVLTENPELAAELRRHHPLETKETKKKVS